MATTIRPELSQKNKYWISRHRYYELKHFCLQYPLWKKSCAELDGLARRSVHSTALGSEPRFSDPTANCAEAKMYFYERMNMLERTAAKTDAIIGNYILQAVTTGMSYDILKAKLEIPCCKDTYYDLYRKFFWILDKERG